MKPFADLTDDELLALSEEEITYYIDRECAEEGIPLLPPSPPKPPTKAAIDDDMTIYTVNGVVLSDRVEAEGLRNYMEQHCASRGKLGYVSGHYTRRVFEPNLEGTEYAVHTALSKDKSLRLASDIDAYENDKNRYQKEESAYETTQRRREQTADIIRKRIRSARRTNDRKAELGRQFERYIELADGNRAIAARFLAKAHTDARELRPDLFADADAAGVETPTAKTEEGGVAVADDDIPY